MQWVEVKVTGMIIKFKNLVSALLCIITIIGFCMPVSAEEPASTDLVIIQKAMLNQIEYDAMWLDVNADGNCNLKDLIRMKKYLAGTNDTIVPIKYIDVTFVDDSNTVTQRQYRAKCELPELSKNNSYWKIGNQYYNEKNTVSLNTDTTVTAVKSKKDVDFPIIDF